MSESTTGNEQTMDRRALLGMAALGVGGMAASTLAQPGANDQPSAPSELVVLWTSADPDVAHRVGLMYCHAAKRFGWFDKVRLVIWGPSQRTLVGDKDLKAKVKEMQDDGIETQACIACAKSFGITGQLEALGFEVLGMGGPLTRFLKSSNHAVLTV